MNDERVIPVLMAELASRTDWDESPDLLFMCDGDETHHPGQLELHPLGVAPEFWMMAPHPLDMLDALVRGMAAYDSLPDYSEFGFPKPPPPVLPPTFAGLVFRFEAWGIDPEVAGSPDPAVRERIRRAAAEHDLHAQPERVESRQILACSSTGEFYWAQQQRGHEPMTLPEHSDPDGRLPKLLAELTMEFLALAARR